MDSDAQRFEQLFRNHYALVMRYAVRRVGRDGAPEVVNETFLNAWRRLDDVPDEPLPWLYGVARRVVANELRRRSRVDRLAGRVGASTPPPAEVADTVTDQVRVRAALAMLSDRDGEILRLSAWEQLTIAETAQVMGCSVAACKVRLHRARRRLQALLTATDHDVTTLIPEGDIR